MIIGIDPISRKLIPVPDVRDQRDLRWEVFKLRLAAIGVTPEQRKPRRKRKSRRWFRQLIAPPDGDETKRKPIGYQTEHKR